MGVLSANEKCPQMKTLKLFIPRRLAVKNDSRPSKQLLSPSWQQAATSDKEAEIIRAFINEAPPGSTISPLKTHEKTSARVEALMHRFHVPEGQFLPLSRPDFVRESPFQEISKERHHSKIGSSNSSSNGKDPVQKDDSITDSLVIEQLMGHRGRLSVTKLITGLWCELQTFYEIYSGVSKSTTNAMALGSKHHLELEHETHKPVDISKLTTTLQEMEHELTQKIDSEVIQEDKEMAEFKLKILTGKEPENELAWDWLQDIIAKLFGLLNHGEAREILAHGYVNEASNQYKRPNKKVKLDDRDILVSGIIDHLFIDTNLDGIINISQNYPPMGQDGYKIDLTDFVNKVPPKIDFVLSNGTLEVCDVKTRKSKMIPLQNSVLEAAKLQVAHYRKMLEVLAEDPEATYLMLLENAHRRGLDIDQPIGALKAIEMARVHGNIVIRDFERLCKGEPIGMTIFDEFKHPKSGFSMEGILQEAKLKEVEGDDFDYSIFETINGEWITPLSLRYFAARAAQFYHLIGPLLGNETLVEYHNIKEQGKGSVIAKLEYEYNPEILSQSLNRSMKFWTGARNPEPTDLLLKCKYCDFRKNCSIPRPSVDDSFREGFYKLIQQI